MTDDDKALVERLRWGVWHFDNPYDGEVYSSDDPLIAADRIIAQAAEIKELRGVVDALLQHEASSFFGPDEGKHKRASWRGVIRKAKKARTVYSVAEALDLRKAEQ